MIMSFLPKVPQGAQRWESAMFDTFDTEYAAFLSRPLKGLAFSRSNDPRGGMLCGSPEMFGRYFLRRCEGTQNQMCPITNNQSRLSRHQSKQGIDWGPKVPSGLILLSTLFFLFLFFGSSLFASEFRRNWREVLSISIYSFIPTSAGYPFFLPKSQLQLYGNTNLEKPPVTLKLRSIQ